MANMIIASSSKSLINSPLIPKHRQPSFSLPQISLRPTAKPIQFPSFSNKSITVSTAATPLPSLATGLEKAVVFYFGPYLSVILSCLAYLSLEVEVAYLEDKKIQSFSRNFPEVKQPEEQSAELWSTEWAAIEAMWNAPFSPSLPPLFENFEELNFFSFLLFSLPLENFFLFTSPLSESSSLAKAVASSSTSSSIAKFDGRWQRNVGDGG